MRYGSDAITAPLGRARGTGLRGLGPWQIVWLLAVLVGSAVAGNLVFANVWGTGEKAAPTYTVGAATRGTITTFVNASGTVSPTRQVKLTAPSAGRVARVSVRQGDSVTEGQEIAALDTTNLQIKRDTVASQLAAARARLEGLLAAPTAADLAAQQQAVASAQATLTRAENDLATLLAGPTAEDVAAARAALDRAQAALDVAQANYDKLVRGEDLTLRPEYTALKAAQADYQAALTAYATKTAPPAAADVTAAQQAVASARAQVEAAQAKLNALLNPNPADVAAAQAQVQSAQAQLEAARAKYASIYIGGSLTDVQAAEAQLQATQAAYDAALARQSTVRADASSTRSDLASAEAAVAQAKANLIAAQNNLAKVKGQQVGPDISAAEQAVRQAEASVATAQNNLNRLLTPPAADLATAQQQLAAAQQQLAAAQANYDKLLAGPTADELAQLQATLDRAKAALDTAQTNWDRLVNGTDLASRAEATALNNARADYQNALAAYTAKTAGAKPGDVQVARAAVDSARAALAAAQARLAQVQAGTLPTDLAQQQEAVRQLELALQSAQNDLDAAVIRAPFAGTVVAVNVNEGDQVGANGAVATLLDPTLVRIDATLDETRVNDVKRGMPVLITFDAFPGQSFTGTVAAVTPAGVTQQGVVTFPVTIVFDPRGVVIPTGATATLRVVTQTLPNVVTVPSRALQRQGRDVFVEVILPDGKTERRQVVAGPTGDNGQVQIISGLQEGDQVAIPVAQRTGQTTTGTFGVGGLGGGPVTIPAQQPRR
jgi:HlyD family secretion protein